MRTQEPRTYYTYIMGSRSGVLYVGITGDLMTRTLQHKTRAVPSFTSGYRITRLLYFEEFGSPSEAIAREKGVEGVAPEQKARPDTFYKSRLERPQHGMALTAKNAS